MLEVFTSVDGIRFTRKKLANWMKPKTLPETPTDMLRLPIGVFGDLLRSQASLEAEIIVLRHQVAVLRRRLGRKQLQLTWADRALLVIMSRLWSGWRDAVFIVQPETFLRWHGRGFRAYWRWKSRPRGGRPRIPTDVRALISRMHRENPLWGAPRIHGELLMLGIDVSESTVSNYLASLPRQRPTQRWRTYCHIWSAPLCEEKVRGSIKGRLRTYIRPVYGDVMAPGPDGNPRIPDLINLSTSSGP